MPRCPKCWSGIDRLAGDCPHCGAPLDGRRRRRSWLVYLFAATAGAGGFLLMQALSHEPDVAEPVQESPPATAESESLPEPVRMSPPDSSATQLAPAHWRLGNPQGGTVDLLALRGTAGSALVGLWSTMPPDGLPMVGGQPVDFPVLQLDAQRNLILMAAPQPLPNSLEPRDLASVDELSLGEAVMALTPAGQQRMTDFGPRRPDGSFELSEQLPPATALLLAPDRLLAIVLPNGRAMPLQSLHHWLDLAPSSNLAAVIAERRRIDPALLLEDVDRLLRGKPSSAELRQALQDLAAASMHSGDRELIEALTRCECDAWRMLTRNAFELDPADAVPVINQGLARHPSDPGLLQDAAMLLAQVGDAQQALSFFAQLQILDPERAQAIEAALAEALTARAARLDRGERSGEAITLLEAASHALPLRAELQAALAGTLQRSGRGTDALAAARRAASLDPSYRELATQLAEDLAQANDPDVVSIPFDPKTFAIRTEVKAAGVPVQLVVDTGATTTTIPIAVADRLGLRSPQNPRSRIQTASGIVEAEVVRLPTLSIGSLQLRNVEAIAHDLPGTLAGTGLLGMNALQQFRVEIDSERGQMLLKRR